MSYLHFYIIMFQNAYQNGLFFEVFDPKLPQDKTKNLYKLQNVQPNHKVFDKALKTFIYEFTPSNSRITFPKEDRKQLYLIQQYLNIQVQFTTADWNIQLTVSDLTKTKRRIILSPAVHKLQKKPFFLKYNCPSPKTNSWVNLCIDLYSFIEGFKGQTYRSLDIVQLTGGLKLRRVFTTNQPLTDNDSEGNQNLLLPKNLLFPPQVQYSKQFIQYSEPLVPQQINMSIEVGGKASKVTTNKSIKRENTRKIIQDQKQQKNMRKPKVEQIKQKPSIISSHKVIEPQKSSKIAKQEKEKEKKFLANTNGIVSFKDKATSNKKDDSTQEVSKSNITPLSTGKGIKKKREPLSKANITKEKKTSIEKVQKKNNLTSQKQVNKNSQKLNPWRSSVKRKNETGRDSPQKIDDTRKIQSAQTALFVTQNNLIEKANGFKDKHFDRNSDCSRQSDYFQLSQKFSTVNQGKFFKHEKPQHNLKQQQKQHFNDEIQQNIEVETNSHYSNSQRNSACKNKQNLFVVDLQQKPLQQSINDSLDEFNAPKLNQKPTFLSQNESYFNMSSRFGFGQKMMSKFMKQLQRPYSPPLCQKQLTQDADKQQQDLGEKNGVELLYDPVLNCYYDHKTHTYYELKN